MIVAEGYLITALLGSYSVIVRVRVVLKRTVSTTGPERKPSSESSEKGLSVDDVINLSVEPD